jgi:hypothetical protein
LSARREFKPSRLASLEATGEDQLGSDPEEEQLRTGDAFFAAVSKEKQSKSNLPCFSTLFIKACPNEKNPDPGKRCTYNHDDAFLAKHHAIYLQQLQDSPHNSKLLHGERVVAVMTKNAYDNLGSFLDDFLPICREHQNSSN